MLVFTSIVDIQSELKLAREEMHNISLWLHFGVGQLCPFDLYQKSYSTSDSLFVLHYFSETVSNRFQ